jgi:hypothetical protein
MSTEKLKIKIDQSDKLIFPTVAYTRNISSNVLCKELKFVFEIFGDFKGFGANYNSVNGAFTLNAYFAQTDAKDSEFRGFTREGLTGKGGNLLDRVNRMSSISENGNKFYMTDEAKEMIAPFIHQFYKNRDGSVNWQNCVSSVAERSYTGGFGQTYSVIMNIDPVALMREAYGDKIPVVIGTDSEKKAITELREVEYEVFVRGTVPSANNIAHLQQGGNNSSGPFNLDVRCVDKVEFTKTKPELGYVSIGPNFVE